MLRLFKSLLYLNRTPEILECIRSVENPFELIGRYLKVSSREYPFGFRFRNGPIIQLNDYHDLVTSWVVFLRKEYRVPQNTNSIVDLGANIGCFSLFSSMVARESRIYACEPFPKTYDRLIENISVNSLEQRIFACSAGVAAKTGTRKMSLVTAPSQSRGLSTDCDRQDSIDVAVYSLSEILGQACDKLNVTEIDFVKIDVEGAEHEAIRACEPKALRRMRRLAMEYHPNKPKVDLFSHLQYAGFKIERDISFGTDVGLVHFIRS